MRVTLLPPLCGQCSGTVRVPASKSAAHRALVCAALAQGHSLLEGLTPSRDMTATQEAMRLLGAKIAIASGEDMARSGGLYTAAVTGQGFPFAPPACAVDCGESGSTLRFLIPLFSLCGTRVRLTGEGRLPERPQGVYAEIFAARGLLFEQDAGGVTLEGALDAGIYTVSGAVSSQFISGLLFALPLIPGDSVLTITPPFESRSYVELTLQTLTSFGVQAGWRSAGAAGEETVLEIPGGQVYRACAHYAVEGDHSQAAFFAVLAAVQSAVGGAILLEGLRMDSLQGDKVIFEILRRCGVQVQILQNGAVCVSGGVPLHGVEIDLADCPDLGPILMVLGLFCDGKTVLRNAGRLRMKESDRIAAMETEICRMGGEIHSTGDIVTVQKSILHGADLQSHNDHRVVMSMSVAALAAGVSIHIDGAQAVEKSYPHFFRDLTALGAGVVYK